MRLVEIRLPEPKGQVHLDGRLRCVEFPCWVSLSQGPHEAEVRIGGQSTRAWTVTVAGDAIQQLGRFVPPGAGSSGTPKPAAQTNDAHSLKGFCKETDIPPVVKAHSAALSKCYESVLPQRVVQGKLASVWRIGPEGSVTLAQVAPTRSTLLDAEVALCVLAEIETWAFPKPEGGSCQIVYPLKFDFGDGSPPAPGIGPTLVISL